MTGEQQCSGHWDVDEVRISSMFESSPKHHLVVDFIIAQYLTNPEIWHLTGIFIFVLETLSLYEAKSVPIKKKNRCEN